MSNFDQFVKRVGTAKTANPDTICDQCKCRIRTDGIPCQWEMTTDLNGSNAVLISCVNRLHPEDRWKAQLYQIRKTGMCIRHVPDMGKWLEDAN